jgi:GDP/UDP-N,N'-diacetylbacillosamine 2-epimerase (hydrolysing)
MTSSKFNRKVCVITGSRAEYGLLKILMRKIQADPNLTLQIMATGMHVSNKFGDTIKEIEADGFKVDYKIKILEDSDGMIDIANSMSIAIKLFAQAINNDRPDLIVVLGDRFEIFSAVTIALIYKIPVAHIHGGESTQGLLDEAFRHSITKMSHLHFVSALAHKKKVMQLGENPKNIFLVGGLGVDAIKESNLLSKKELEQVINFKFGLKNLLVTFHPVTLEISTARSQMQELLSALTEFKDIHLIFTMPNADIGNQEIFDLISEFTSTRSNAIAFKSLGQLRYFSCLAQVDGLVGNSSSGLLEAPSFKKATVNIGDRQLGRIQAKSVIQCRPVKKEIINSINRIYSEEFQNLLKNVKNPFGEGGASEKIYDIIRSHPLENLIKKSFYTLGKK